MYTPLEIVLISAAVFIASALQGSFGIGFGLIASPLLILLDPQLIPGPLMVTGEALCILILWREKQAIDFSGMRWTVYGLLPGVISGALLVSRLPVTRLVFIFAVLILLAVVMSLFGQRLPRRRAVMLAAGALSGFMSTVGAVGGPPLALIYQDSSGPQLRTTIAALFAISGVFALASLATVGRLGLQELWLGALLLPGTLAGLVLSSRLVRLFDGRYIRASILSLSALAAILAIVRQLA